MVNELEVYIIVQSATKKFTGFLAKEIIESNMRISFLQPNINSYKQKNEFSNFQNLKPLKYDTVSFGAMKKTKFSGFDAAVVEKYKAPIEKFNSNEDFENWTKSKIEELAKRDYKARQKDSQIQREALLKEWFIYVLQGNSAFTPAMQLIILDAITKNLKPNNDELPPVLNKGVLADCISELNKSLKENPKNSFNFHKMYKTKLNAFYLEDTNTGEEGTKWIIIPSKNHDSENFEANVTKLQTLSHKNWCTKSFNAEPYLEKGDFHVYLVDGKPKIGLRFEGKKLQEIQGEKNNTQIPMSYYDIITDYIEKNGLETSFNAHREIRMAHFNKKRIEQIKNHLYLAIQHKDTQRILNYFGIETEQDENGKLIIDEFREPDSEFTYKDLGINENDLFKDIIEIKRNAYFSNYDVTNLGCLERIGGCAYFQDSKVSKLGNLKSIGKFVIFGNSQITDLENLETINEDARFDNSRVKSLGKLKYIGSDAHFEHCPINSLGELEYIGKDAYFTGSNIDDLGKLKMIRGDAYFAGSPITSLKDIEVIMGDAFFGNSSVTDLGALHTIGRSAYFKNSKITDLGNLQTIRRHPFYIGSLLKEEDFANIQHDLF